MIGKTIGYKVHNWTNNTTMVRNDFKICIFNKYGYQLAPSRGQSAPKHDPTWMYCANYNDA